MRVLMLSDVFFPRVNGVSTSIRTFRNSLNAHGVQVHLVAPDYGVPDNHADAAWVTRVKSRSVPFDREDRIANKREMVEVARYLLPAIIHIQTPFAAHYAGLELARFNRVPVIATYHTLFEEYLHHYIPVLPGALTRRLARSFSRRQCNELDGVIVPSTAMADRLLDYGVTAPLHVLPTGIPINGFRNGDREAFRRRHHISDTKKVALYVGRVAHEKNIDFLLQVAARCRDSHPDLLWVIAGEGPAVPDLKALAARLKIADRTLFIGYMNRETELPDCYAGADTFVFASRTETQGLVLLEAMAAGLPVVALSAMGTSDIVDPGMGAVAPKDDVVDFATRLSDLLTDEPRRLGMKHVARMFAERWSDHAKAAELNALYRRVRFAKLSQAVRDDDLAAA